MVWGIILKLVLCVMVKAADPYDFSREQILVAQLFKIRICETARFEGCSWLAVVNTYAIWMSWNSTRYLGKITLKNVSHCESASDSSSAQKNVGPSTAVSEHTVQPTLRDTGLRIPSKRATRVPLRTKHHRQLILHGTWVNHGDFMVQRERVAWLGEMRIFIHHIYSRFLTEQSILLIQHVIHSPVVAVLCFGGRSHGFSTTHVCGRTNHENCGMFEHRCRLVVSLHCVSVPSWKWSFPSGHRSMSQGWNCTGVVPGT